MLCLSPILKVILGVCKSVYGGFPSTFLATKPLHRSNTVYSSLKLVANQHLFSFTPATTCIMMNTMVQNEAEVSINTLIVIIWSSNLSTFSLPDEGDSRIVSCTLILKSMFFYHLITYCTCSPLLICHDMQYLRGPGWLNELGSWVT